MPSDLIDSAEILQEGPFTVPGQIRGPLCNYGACDPLFRDSPSALLPYRFSTGAFQFQLIGNDLSLVANSQISLFVAGVGQDAGEQGWPAGVVMTEAMTDCFRDGTPCERGQLFVATGMTLSVKQPYRMSAAQCTYAPWIDEYAPRLQQAILQNVSIEYVYGNTACRYRLGVVDHWADWAGATGPVINNGSPTAGVFLPFRAATVISARDEARKLTVNLKIGAQALVISENGAGPAIDSDVVVPVQLKLVGFPVCAQEASACGTSSSEQELIGRVLRKLQAQG